MSSNANLDSRLQQTETDVDSLKEEMKDLEKRQDEVKDLQSKFLIATLCLTTYCWNS